jgi:hypothetical protein
MYFVQRVDSSDVCAETKFALFLVWNTSIFRRAPVFEIVLKSEEVFNIMSRFLGNQPQSFKKFYLKRKNLKVVCERNARILS